MTSQVRWRSWLALPLVVVLALSCFDFGAFAQPPAPPAPPGPGTAPANAAPASTPPAVPGPNGTTYSPAPQPLPTLDKAASLKDLILAGIGNSILALVSAHGLEIAKAAIVDTDSSSAKLSEGANINVDVGDVYKIEAILDYSSWNAPVISHKAGVYDDYMYALYINGEKKFEDQVGQAPTPKKSWNPKDWNPAGNLNTKIAIYLVATNLRADDCTGTGKDVIAVRTWIRSGRVTASMSPDAIKKLVHVTGENWREGESPPAAATVTVLTHDPWLVQMDQYPKGSIDHHGANTAGQAQFRLLQNRSFPGDHPADPPKELQINVSIWSTGGDGHFRFGTRSPEAYRQGLVTNSTMISFTQPYQHFGFKTHHEPHANGSAPLVIGGMVWGERTPLPGGPAYEWQVKPRSIPGKCLNYEWNVEDVDNAPVGEVSDGRSDESEGLDACLVGTWRSESVALLEHPMGGGGIVLKIKGDGTESIDYAGMKPLKGVAGETNSWSGASSGVISANHGHAQLVRVDSSELTHTLVDPNGKTTSNKLDGLGPAALGPNRPPDYTCDQQTLSFKDTMHTFVYKREAE